MSERELALEISFILYEKYIILTRKVNQCILNMFRITIQNEGVNSMADPRKNRSIWASESEFNNMKQILELMRSGVLVLGAPE